MKALRKLALVALVMLVSVSTLLAVDFDFSSDAYGGLAQPFTKTSARLSAMGGAGLAVFNNQDSLYINPASLGEKGLVFNVPNVSFTLYNIKSGYVESDILQTVIENPDQLTDMDFLTDNVLGGVLEMLSTAGQNKIATIDAGFGMKLGRLAFALDSQVNLNTYLPVGSSTLDIMFVPQVDVAATFGLGMRLFRDSAFNIDIGVSASLQMRAIMNAMDASTAINALTGESEEGGETDPVAVFDSLPIAVGWGLPITVGVNVNMPFGLTIANVVSNIHLINGGYNYVLMDSYNDFVDDLGGSLMKPFEEDPVFTAKSDMIYSIGLGWAPDLGGFEWIIDPTIAVDVVDVVGLFDNPNATSFLQRLKLGAEVQLFKALEVRAGLNGGYVSVGAGVNLFNVIHIEASYYWNEFGEVLGEKDVDAFTIRFNIGWER